MSKIGLESVKQRFCFINDEHGFVDTVTSSASATLGDRGIILLASNAGAQISYNFGAINPFLVEEIQAVEFVFRIDDTHADANFVFGLSNGGADADVPNHAIKSYLGITNLACAARNDDGTTDESFTSGESVIEDEWIKLRLSLDQEVKSVSPPGTSSGQVASYSITQGQTGTSAGYNRRVALSGQPSLAAVKTNAISPVVYVSNTSGSTATTQITLNSICVEFRGPR